jgi:hypothetical protein
MPGAYLVYIYETVARDERPPALGTLTPSRLLVPPLFINRLPWTRGYFETAGFADLEPDDRLAQHCFRDTTGWYLDEAGHQLDALSEPCGDWALYSYTVLDDVLSDATGIPRASG